MVTEAMKLKDVCSLQEKLTNLESMLKKRDNYFVNKGPSSQRYGFSSSHVQMWEMDNKKRLSAEELMSLNCGAGEDS